MKSHDNATINLVRQVTKLVLWINASTIICSFLFAEDKNMQFWSVIVTQVVLTVPYGLVLRLLQRKKRRQAKIIFAAAGIFQLSALVLLMGTNNSIHIFFIVTMFSSWFIFSDETSVLQYYFTVTSALCFIGSYLFYDLLGLPTILKGDLHYAEFNVINSVCMVIGLIYVLRAYSLKIQAYEDMILQEKARSEGLLYNTLPQAIASRLIAGESTIADSFSDATVIFADIVNFCEFSKSHTPNEIVKLLNELFSAFDQVVESHGAEKIKTIGDAYMLVVGIPDASKTHAEVGLRVAEAMLDETEVWRKKHQIDLQLRIGMHSGPIIAGVIGKHRVSFDLWGHTVNIAARLESSSLPGRIHTSAQTAKLLQKTGRIQERDDMVDIKGYGKIESYFINRGVISTKLPQSS